MASRESQIVWQNVFATSQKIGFTKTTFLAYIVPPFACQYLMGVLVQLEGTRFYRLALLPIAVWLAWRATLVDMSGGDPEQIQANSMLITQMCSILTRTASWAFAHIRYRRHSPVNNRNKSDSDGVYSACWNAWDLLLNPRGLGWNWPRGLIVPKPMYETDSRLHFVLLSAPAVVFNALVFDACVHIIRALGPDTFGSLQGGSLFDHSLPPVLEYLRAVLVATLTTVAAYFGLQYTHQFIAIVCIILFQQHPSQWPPLFDSPWLSSSLGDLWGHRWHQMMRDMVMTLGGQPINYLLGGRLGGILGAFLVSGIFHDIELRSGGRGGDSVSLIGFWLVNGLGIVLERVWKRVTGSSVGGMWGRIWVVGWLLVWGIPVVNAYAVVGRFGAWCLPGRFEPSRALVAFVWRRYLSSGFTY